MLYCCLPVTIRVQLISLVAQQRCALYGHIQLTCYLMVKEGYEQILTSFFTVILLFLSGTYRF
jgi:hypothetical protein